MLNNLTISSRVGVLAAIDPDAYTAATYTTGWVDMQDWFWIMAIVMAGDLGASATLDAKIEQATSNGGAGAKDITGLSIAQLTQAGTDSNKQALINIGTEDLDFNNAYRFVRLSMTVATATSDAGAVLIGMNPRYGAPNATDATTVDEIVS